MSTLIQPNTVEHSLFYTNLRAKILIKTRLDKMDSMIDIPTEEELDLAIMDSISMLNTMKPISHYRTLDLSATSDGNLEYLLLIGACFQIFRTIWNSWGHTGDELNLSILHEKDRFSEFEQMMNDFEEEFLRAAGPYKDALSTGLMFGKGSKSFVSTRKNIRSGGTGRPRFKSGYGRR